MHGRSDRRDTHLRVRTPGGHLVRFTGVVVLGHVSWRESSEGRAAARANSFLYGDCNRGKIGCSTPARMLTIAAVSSVSHCKRLHWCVSSMLCLLTDRARNISRRSMLSYYGILHDLGTEVPMEETCECNACRMTECAGHKNAYEITPRSFPSRPNVHRCMQP